MHVLQLYSILHTIDNVYLVVQRNPYRRFVWFVHVASMKSLRWRKCGFDQGWIVGGFLGAYLSFWHIMVLVLFWKKSTPANLTPKPLFCYGNPAQMTLIQVQEVWWFHVQHMFLFGNVHFIPRSIHNILMPPGGQRSSTAGQRTAGSKDNATPRKKKGECPFFVSKRTPNIPVFRIPQVSPFTPKWKEFQIINSWARGSWNGMFLSGFVGKFWKIVGCQSCTNWREKFVYLVDGIYIIFTPSWEICSHLD